MLAKFSENSATSQQKHISIRGLKFISIRDPVGITIAFQYL
jgi:hypothetical protein